MFKYFFTSKLNDSQKVEFYEILEIFYEDLENFKQKDLKYLKRLQNFSLFYVFLTIYIQFYIDYSIYAFGILSILCNIYFTLIIYKKEKFFLYNYNFSKYNLSKDVIKFLEFSLKCKVFSDIILITLCGLITTNDIFSKFMGYNPLKQFLMSTGFHKYSPFSFWNKSNED